MDTLRVLQEKGWRAFLCQVNKALSGYTLKKACEYYAGVTCAPCKGQPKLVTVLLVYILPKRRTHFGSLEGCTLFRNLQRNLKRIGIESKRKENQRIFYFFLIFKCWK